MRIPNKSIFFVIALVLFGYGAQSVAAQGSGSTFYVPLIGITSVPEPLALPKGAGPVTYHYAVKNFLQEVALTGVHVVDDKCSPVEFVEGDDNGDAMLDYSETWRYTCTTTLSETTQSTATATGMANSLTATHKAYATVVVGSDSPPPLVSIINITKVAYPLSLPTEGGDITFTYKVNNPGIVPLSEVTVTDDKCHGMSGKLGDTNYNNLLDINEVWIYTCTTHLNQTTTNTVSVTAVANGLKAIGYATITVKVDSPTPIAAEQPVPNLPETGGSPTVKMAVWGILFAILAALIAIFLLTRKRKGGEIPTKPRVLLQLLVIVFLIAGIAGAVLYFFWSPQPNRETGAKVPSGQTALDALSDELFGWKYPVAKFPTTGSTEIAYSDIRDPGGIPQGLPVRLKIPVISVDSAIEDALITPDGKMDVPSGSVHVAWFALGPHPGQKGSSVIGGHFGISNGVPFVFYNLDKLTIGDKVYIVDDKGDTLTFIVRSTKSFDRDADATSVFTSQDGLAHLNIITCEGLWNQVNGSYPQRLVVFTDAVPTVGAVVPKAPVVSTGPRSLSMGARGVDVVALQTALEQKSFLTMPPGVAKGVFGTLTRAAVRKYQTSVGLPSNGVFGLSTRNNLIAAKPTLPSTALTPEPAVEPTAVPSVPPTPVSASPLTQIGRNLFDTALDGTITSLLLIAIIFVAFHIIRRI